MGQVLTAAAGQNPARQAAIQAGIYQSKNLLILLNQVCGSGLRSIAAGYQAIMSNDSNIMLQEDKKVCRMHLMQLIFVMIKKLEESNLVDTMIKDGLWDAFNGYHMGITAENVATKWKITRKDQDDFCFIITD